MLKFTQDHEWLSVEGDTATIGITHHAQEQLGDLVFVELPKPGRSVDAGGAAAVVEILQINHGVVDDPSLVNADPMGKGWFFKMKIADRSQVEALMDEQAYRTLIDSAEPA